MTAEQLLEARRPEDMVNSLWVSMNRLQENLTRGGLSGRSAQGRRLQTRPITSIDWGVGLNRPLWMVAEEMLNIKG